MKPRDRAIAALSRKQPDMVPTMEIDFQLHEELLGKKLILGEELNNKSQKEKERALRYNAEVYAECAEVLDLSAITVHPIYWEIAPGIPTKYYYPTLEDELEVIKQLYKLIGDRYLVAAGIDGTYSIPDGNNMLEFIYYLNDNPDDALNEAEKRVEDAVEQMERMIDAGAEIMYCCSDYCFNTGPFLSPAMFEKFIYPFLKKQIRALKRAGAYVIKHTDGNILPIIEMLIDAEPHAIHSLDPIAGIDIKLIKERYGSRVCLMGNVDCSKLQMGTKEEVIESATYAILSGKPDGGYIFSSCNTIFEGVPLENYLTMLEVRKELGKYDSNCSGKANDNDVRKTHADGVDRVEIR